MSTEREQVEALADLMQEAAELPQLDGARLILNSALLAEVKAAARAESARKVTENDQEYLMRTLTSDQWKVVAAALKVEIAEHGERIAQEFRREADPSTTGIWREACDLLDRIARSTP